MPAEIKRTPDRITIDQFELADIIAAHILLKYKRRIKGKICRARDDEGVQRYHRQPKEYSIEAGCSVDLIDGVFEPEVTRHAL